MPFASGQRMCLGYNFAMLEIKVSAEVELMHKTIQSFTFHLMQSGKATRMGGGASTGHARGVSSN